MLSLSACGSTGAPVKVPQLPDRPMISPQYEGMLRACPVETQKEAMKHEWDWHGWADKAEDRMK